MRANVKFCTWVGSTPGLGLTVWRAAVWIWGPGAHQAGRELAIGPSSKSHQQYPGLC